MDHFILIYDHDHHTLIHARPMGEDADKAVEAYADCERKYRNQRGIEIVLVGADSLETIQKTHSHYFSDDAFRDFFEDVVVG